MTTWQLGSTISWPLEVYNTAGALEDLGGGDPTATVTRPDATTASATVTKTATGKYRADLTSTLVGRYRVVWTGTGTNSGGLPYADIADVWPADPRLIVGLSDIRATLNKLVTSRIDDDELRGYLVAATVVIEHLCGPKLQATVTETRSGGRQAILLHQLPASITSVTEDGTSVATTGYCLDEGGVLWRGSMPRSGWWATGARNVVVTYTVGASVVQQNVILAAAHLVAHWWRQTQQNARPMLGVPAGEVGLPMVAGYAVPNIVTDLLRPSDTRMPGLA